MKVGRYNKCENLYLRNYRLQSNVKETLNHQHVQKNKGSTRYYKIPDLRKNKIQTLEGKYRFGKKDIETNLKYTMTVYKLVEKITQNAVHRLKKKNKKEKLRDRRPVRR